MRTAYFALIQIVMLSVEFLAVAQRQRLLEHYPNAGLNWPSDGPFADLYIMALDSPTTGRFRERLLHATEIISEHLVADELVGSVIRRIAYVEASASGDLLTSQKRFATDLR